jgi:hypothetical protein
MKKILIAAVVIVVAVATLPLWGGCDLNAKACSTWCSVRHFNSDVKEAGCRARCATDKVSCLAEAGAEGVDDFIEGFNK